MKNVLNRYKIIRSDDKLMDNTMNYLSILKESLNKKIDVLNEILRLNELQKESVSGVKFDEEKFEEMIEKKTVCIEELTRLDNGFEAVYANVKEILSKDSASYKSEIEEMKKLISEITEKSMEVQLSEKRNEKLVYSKMSEERIKIRKSKNANKVASDYYKSMSGGNVVEPQFLDKKK